MKTLVLVLVGLFILPSMVMARDLGEITDTVLDTLNDENGSCPALFSPYVAKTFKDYANLPIVGEADLRAELSYTSSIDDLSENNSVKLKVGLEF